MAYGEDFEQFWKEVQKETAIHDTIDLDENDKDHVYNAWCNGMRDPYWAYMDLVH